MWDWRWLNLRQVSFLFAYSRQYSQHLFSGYQASFLQHLLLWEQHGDEAFIEGGEDWNMHWQQGGDGAFMRGGRRHPRQDQGRRVVLLVLFSWSINSAQILILQLFLGGEGVVGGRGRDII